MMKFAPRGWQPTCPYWRTADVTDQTRRGQAGKESAHPHPNGVVPAGCAIWPAPALEKSWLHFFRHIRATIGFDAKTAIFSVVNTVLLKPLSYANADRLVNFLFSASGIADNLHCVAEFHFFERQTNLFKEVVAFDTTPAHALTWAGSSRPEQLSGIY